MNPKSQHQSNHLRVPPASSQQLASFVAIACLVAAHLAVAQNPVITPTPRVQSRVPSKSVETAQSAPPREPAPQLSTEELESLVGPVALYPDSLLVQTLAASTYPLEIVQLKQWLDKNKNLKGQALIDGVAQQNWDPSIQALSAFPAVVDKLFNNIEWTADLGNAFLAQEAELMDAVQRLRVTAQANGALKTNDKQTVGTTAVKDGTEAITIEPAQREVIYVPTYNTRYVYRDSGYANYSGYTDSSDSSSYSDDGYAYLGYAVAAAYGAYWGYYNWRDRYAEVNYNNYYNYRYKEHWDNDHDRNWNNKGNNWNTRPNNWNNRSANAAGSGRWQHDPFHRGNSPYPSSNLANRFGQGTNRFAEGGAVNRSSQLAREQLTRAGNFSRPGNARGVPRDSWAGRAAPNRIGNRVPSNWPNGARGGAFGPPRGDFARAATARGMQSFGPAGGFRGGPPAEFRGGPPGGFHGGPPAGFGGGGPPIGGFGGGPPMGGGAPPPPPPHP